MVSVKDIAWAAGFLEGEGSFSLQKSLCPKVQASQKGSQPLERLRTMFGGKVYLRNQKYKGMPRPIYSWEIHGPTAAGIMMSIYGLMSCKRKDQIKHSVTQWMTTLVHPRYRIKCINGHSFNKSNTYYGRKRRYCKQCERVRYVKKYARHRLKRKQNETAQDKLSLLG